MCSPLRAASTDYISQSICAPILPCIHLQHTSEWPCYPAEQVSIHASSSSHPPQLLSVVTKRGQDRKGDEDALCIWDQGLRGAPTTGSLCSNVGRETPGTFFLYPVTVISNQTQHLALSCLSCLCFIFSPLFLKGFSRRLLLTYHFVLQIWNYFYKIRILVPQANLNQESEPRVFSNLNQESFHF